MKHLFIYCLAIVLFFTSLYQQSVINHYNQRYGDLERVFEITTKRTWTQEYNCEDFSKDAIWLLSQKRVIAQYQTGFVKQQPNSIPCPEESRSGEKCAHAWISVHFEPQTGELVRDYEL
jgi:hypothetical protein